LGKGYFNLEELDRAVEYLSKALALDNKNSEALILLAKIYEKKGKVDKAMEQAAEAINL